MLLSTIIYMSIIILVTGQGKYIFVIYNIFHLCSYQNHTNSGACTKFTGTHAKVGAIKLL